MEVANDADSSENELVTVEEEEMPVPVTASYPNSNIPRAFQSRLPPPPVTVPARPWEDLLASAMSVRLPEPATTVPPRPLEDLLASMHLQERTIALARPTEELLESAVRAREQILMEQQQLESALAQNQIEGEVEENQVVEQPEPEPVVVPPRPLEDIQRGAPTVVPPRTKLDIDIYQRACESGPTLMPPTRTRSSDEALTSASSKAIAKPSRSRRVSSSLPPLRPRPTCRKEDQTSHDDNDNDELPTSPTKKARKDLKDDQIIDQTSHDDNDELPTSPTKKARQELNQDK